MCGIVGGFYWDSEPNQENLNRSLSQLQHRGPDEQDTHIVDNIALGHARLSIIDLAGGKQPLHNKSGHLHLVANGEVYNYLEIGKEYPEYSQSALSQSDCEALLQVYEAKGVDGFGMLCGMYAFALYDENEKQLVLGRDRLGIKPLFFCENSQGVFFASEIKALLPLLAESPEINPDALVQFLQNQFHTGRETIFKGIKRVLPGEYICVKGRNVSFHRYWSIADVQTRDISLEEAFEEFEPLFEKVMRQHMRSDVPFGLFLSGGIDSSILLAELRKLDSKELNTYSIGYSGVKMEDELDAAGELAKQFGTQHHAIRVTRDELFERIVHSIWAADDLMRDYASLPTLLLSDVASQDLKVVFSGEAGDEAFAGYRRYAPNLARWINHRVLGRGIRAQGQWHKPVVNSVFNNELKQCNPKAPFRELWDSAPKHWSLMSKRQYVDLNAALVDNLFVKTDRMMMAFGLEGRVPLADHRIVEFGFSLPDKLKYRDNRGKWFLRQWAEKYLPHDHLRKPKRGFYVPVKEWLSGDFADKLGEKLIESPAMRDWFDIDGIKQTLMAHKNGKNYSREIWGMMQFAIWHKLFVEKPGTIPNKSENPLDWI